MKKNKRHIAKKYTSYFGKGTTKFLICLLLSLFTILIAEELIFTISPLKEIEQRHIDERFSERGIVPIKDSSDVIILAISDDTYKGIPDSVRWPWPRDYYARVIRNLNDAGARVIGLDIIMDDEDQYDPHNDSLLFQTIAEAGNVIVAGKISETVKTYTIESLGEDEYNLLLYEQTVQVKKLKENYHNIFFDADSSIGIVNVVGDNDGVYRSYLPFRYSPSTEDYVPTFSFAILNAWYGLPDMRTAESEEDAFILNGTSIPKFDNISMLINYYGPDRTFPRQDFLNVLDDAEFETYEEYEYGVEINTWEDADFRSLFKDKIVIIGSTVEIDRDVFPTSFYSGQTKGTNLMYGVELHANVIQNVLDEFFIVTPGFWTDTLFIILLTFIGFYLTSFIKELKSRYHFFFEAANFLLIAAIVFGLRELSFYLFKDYRFLFTLVSANLAVILGYFVATAYHFIVERRQKNVIKSMFSQYVSTSVVDQIVTNPGIVSLGGEKKNLTVLFTDIADFTSVAEAEQPEIIVAYLNTYLDEMAKIIFSLEGTVDKYIGDSIMAFWGAPVDLPNHAQLACRAALEQQKRLQKMRSGIEGGKLPAIFARTGINTGDMVVGNIGGSQRFDYTVIGDSVNIASRLEGANKEYGTDIIISEHTFDIVKNDFFTRELDFLLIRGRSKPLRVYELLDFAGQKIPEQKREAIGLFGEGLAAYRKKRFEDALNFFERALKADPNDNPSKVYANRSEFYNANPPDDDWDGIFRLHHK